MNLQPPRIEIDEVPGNGISLTIFVRINWVLIRNSFALFIFVGWKNCSLSCHQYKISCHNKINLHKDNVYQLFNLVSVSDQYWRLNNIDNQIILGEKSFNNYKIEVNLKI